MNEEALFALALEKKNAAERQALLDQACAGNAQLRAAIEGLLKASTDAGSFLEHPPLPLDATVVSSAASKGTSGAAEWTARLSFLKPCEKPDRIGKLVSKAGDYEIIEVVGHGGMGAVLRAFDTKLSRVVAVKVMAPELAANPVAVRRFLREATTAAAVHHEHVVTIHAVDDSHQPPYLVMQFVEGQTLQDKIDREGALELKHVLRIGSQAAAGLAAAHKTGLIHRDVKPSNILLENGVERVKISDFGLARAADDVQMTQTGIISGTPQYMSPEQAKGEPIDIKSDLFSLGSVLYSMCTGRPAFRADNPVAVLRRVCDDTPRPIHETNPEIPEWLCEIVEKLMEKRPEQRFQSAQEVADLLAAHLAHLQQPASCPLPPRVTNRPTRTPATANDVIAKEARWFWAAGIMSVVAAGLVLGAMARLSTSLPSPLALWFIGGGLLSLPIGLLIMYAAWQVESRQSPEWAWTAASLSLLPINPFLIFCLPISIWSLVTVRNAHREGLVASKQPLKISPQPSAWPPPVWLWSTGLFLAVLGMLVFFLRAAFSLHSSPVMATVVGLGFFWVTAMCCWSFAIIFHQARFGSGSIGSVCISGAGMMLAVVVMFFGFLKIAFGYDTRPIAPYFVGLMLALVVVMAIWFASTLKTPAPASRHKPSAKPLPPANRGIFIEHPVLGLLAIFMLLVAASAATYMLTAAASRKAGATATADLPASVPSTPALAVAPFDAQQAKAHQETWANHLGVPAEFTNSIGMKLRLIPPGTGVPHPTGLSQSTAPLFLGTTEVTVGQFRRFVEETSHQTAAEKSGLGGARVRAKTRTERKADYVWKLPEFASSDDHPVAVVTWHDAAAFCGWLSQKERRTYRLPTSDEWNWAARAGSAARFYFGDTVSDLDAHAWHLGTSGDNTHPTGNKLPNAWGLFDIYGNVWELSYDFERGGKPIYPVQAKGGPQSAERIYFWGGSFNNPPESVAINGYGNSTVGYSHTGFRVAIVGDLKRSLPETATASSAPASEWVQLFNSQDLTGWKTHSNQPGNWKVENGELVGSGATSHLFSERGNYQDFHLRTEAMISDGGSSGVYFRAPEVAVGRYGEFPEGYEANINSTCKSDTDKTGSLTGSLRGVARYREALHKPDEWFMLEIIARGPQIVIQVNGQTTVDFVDANNTFRRGHFALQVWPAQTVVRFRKIFVRELLTAEEDKAAKPD